MEWKSEGWEFSIKVIDWRVITTILVDIDEILRELDNYKSVAVWN